MKVLIIIFLFAVPSYSYAAQDNFMLSGEGTIRFRYVEADTDSIMGVHGEALKQGLSLKQRFDLSLDISLADFLSLEGTVRISNEDAEEALAPPDLVSTKAVAGWWSINLSKNPFDIIAGTYDASFTPLTLMRWDPNDNPLGAAGCPCQISVGGISGERLEELKEEYRLEGAKALVEGALGDINAIYARPEVAHDGATFRRHMFGARGRLILPYTRNFSSLAIGATGLRVIDDINSVEQALSDPLQSDVFSIDINLPLFWKLSGIAEYARSIRDDNLRSNTDTVRTEDGLIGGLKVMSGDKIEINTLYLQLDPYFSPLYRALSYANNRRGFRASFTYRKLSVFSQLLSISCYLKGVREIKPTWRDVITDWHNSLTDYIVANLGLTFAVFNNWKLEGTYEYRSVYRPEDISTPTLEMVDGQTHITSLMLIYEFTLQSRIMFKYQFINNFDEIGDNDYKAHVPSIQVSVKF